MEAGGESQGGEPEFVDPFDTERDSDSDGGQVAPSASEPTGSTPALKPPAEVPLDEEIPPEPGDPGDLTYAPLAVREAAKLAGMTPEQRARYDAASAEIAAHPAVQSLQRSEDLHDIKMATFREEMRKRLKKEKAT